MSKTIKFLTGSRSAIEHLRVDVETGRLTLYVRLERTLLGLREGLDCRDFHLFCPLFTEIKNDFANAVPQWRLT